MKVLSPAVPLLCSCALGQQPALEVVSRISLGELPETIYRASVCPGDLVLVTSDLGEVLIVDGAAEAVIYHATLPELSGAIGNACDDQGRFYMSASPGLVRVYTFPRRRELVLERTFRTDGLRNRMLAAGGQLYIVGFARAGRAPVFLRQFKLPEGVFLGSPPVDLPVEAGGRFNLFATEGFLFWHPVRKQVAYVPANPLAFWFLDPHGRVAAVERPGLGGFMNVATDSLEKAVASIGQQDRIQGVAALPDGSVVVQAVTRSRGSFAQVFGPDLRPVGAEVPIAAELGHLVGAGSRGVLYFADFAAGGSSLVKARLTY